MNQDSENIKLAFLSWNMQNPFTRSTEYTKSGETGNKEYMNCITEIDKEVKIINDEEKIEKIKKILEFFEKFILLQINLLDEFIMNYFADNNANILFINLQEIFLWNEQYYSKSVINNLNHLYKNFGLLIHYFYKEKYVENYRYNHNLNKYLTYHISHYNKLYCSEYHTTLTDYKGKLHREYDKDNKLIRFEFKIKHNATPSILCFNYAETNGNYRQLGTLCVYISKKILNDSETDYGSETDFYHHLDFETIEYDDTYVLKTYLYNQKSEVLTDFDSDKSDASSIKDSIPLSALPRTPSAASLPGSNTDDDDARLEQRYPTASTSSSRTHSTSPPRTPSVASLSRTQFAAILPSAFATSPPSASSAASLPSASVASRPRASSAASQSGSITDLVSRSSNNETQINRREFYRIKASIYNCHIERKKYNGSKLIKSILKHELKLNDKKYKPQNLFFMGDFNEEDIEMDLYADELLNSHINKKIDEIREILKNTHYISYIKFEFQFGNLTTSRYTVTDTDIHNKLLVLKKLTECKYNNIDNFKDTLKAPDLTLPTNIREMLDNQNKDDINEFIKVISDELNDLKPRKKITSKFLVADKQEVTGEAKKLLLYLISLIDKKNILKYKLNNIIKSTGIDYIISYSRLKKNRSSDSDRIFLITKYDDDNTYIKREELDGLWNKYSQLLSQKYILEKFEEHEVFDTIDKTIIDSSPIDATVKEQLSRRYGFQILSDHYFNFAQFELIADTTGIPTPDTTGFVNPVVSGVGIPINPTINPTINTTDIEIGFGSVITKSEPTDYSTFNKLIINIENPFQSEFSEDIYQRGIIDYISRLHENIKAYDENIFEIYSKLFSILVDSNIKTLNDSGVLDINGFKQEILDKITTELSESVQTGGNIEYYNKYLKYKNKYLNLLRLK